MTTKNKPKKKPVSNALASSVFSGYRPKERAIYRYYDGSKMVAADPLRLQRELAGKPDINWEMDFKIMGSVSTELKEQAQQAFDRIVEAVRATFQVAPFVHVSGKDAGLTDSECIHLLLNFSAFLQGLKKNSRNLPTSLKPTEVGSSTASLTRPSAVST